ncbi:MAG: helix-turn-helix transcriptional regulator [Bacteroidales bacterium]|jgi:plasmid maintenance system antidote protein VapI|nr:helix-turn-helix transcriptional regulator [Bacteroidales bacterium]
MDNNNLDVHLGKMVRQKIGERGITVSEFARRINCSRNNAYNILNRQFIDIPLLNRISIALDYNFFKHFTT